MVTEPDAQRLGVFHGGFPEAEAFPDLGALVFDDPPLPTVPGPDGWVHADLAGEEFDNDGRDLIGALMHLLEIARQRIISQNRERRNLHQGHGFTFVELVTSEPRPETLRFSTISEQLTSKE